VIISNTRLRLKRENSRVKTIKLQENLEKLEIINKNLFDSYEIYEKYFHIEYGVKKKLATGLGINLFHIGSYEMNFFNKIIFTPYIKYNLYSSKKFNVSLYSAFNNSVFNSKFEYNLDLGISIGRSQEKKKRKHFSYYEFYLNPKNFYKFNIGRGIETEKGYLGVISTSYLKTITNYKDVNSDKIRAEIFLAKKLNQSIKNRANLSVFASYFSDFSKYSKIQVSHGIQIGFYYK